MYFSDVCTSVCTFLNDKKYMRLSNLESRINTVFFCQQRTKKIFFVNPYRTRTPANNHAIKNNFVLSVVTEDIPSVNDFSKTAKLSHTSDRLRFLV